MASTVLSTIVDAMDGNKGKRLTFVVADELYGLDISYIEQIIGVEEITNIPKQPNYIKGVINLRGKIIPIVDMRLRFKKEEISYTDRTSTIIVNVNDIQLGIIVDKVTEVINIPNEKIMQVPDFEKGFHKNFIKGIVKLDGKLVNMINEEMLVKHDSEQYNNIRM